MHYKRYYLFYVYDKFHCIYNYYIPPDSIALSYFNPCLMMYSCNVIYLYGSLCLFLLFDVIVRCPWVTDIIIIKLTVSRRSVLFAELGALPGANARPRRSSAARSRSHVAILIRKI